MAKPIRTTRPMETSNRVVEEHLNSSITAIEKILALDCLTYFGPIYPGADDLIRNAIEDRPVAKREGLAVILETSGGYIEITQRIADVFRHNYKRVEFIVPNQAMSAGTVLVMSGDAIHMDYYSTLGPIDPQIYTPKHGAHWLPALGYLVQYKRLIEKSRKGTLTTAELTFLLEKFDPAEMYLYEQARELSITLLKEWLVKYKFKDWVRTETKKRKVTEKMKKTRAAAVASSLNETEKWRSHSRGISMEVARRDLNLKIDDFGARDNLNSAIRTYYRLLRDYMMRRAQYYGVVHSLAGYTPIGGSDESY